MAIKDCQGHGQSWTVMDCHGLSWTVMDCHGLTIMDYHGLSRTIMDYPRLIEVADLSYFYILVSDRLTDGLTDIGT